MGRWVKARGYPLFPSFVPSWHNKRRKGLFYRVFPADGLECQKEQDRIFWTHFLRPSGTGTFLEVGGDGVTGSLTLGLELRHGWTGTIQPEGEPSRQRAGAVRTCRVSAAGEIIPTSPAPDLLAVHRPADWPKILEALQTRQLQPKWVIVENRGPDPHWCRLLESSGYRLRFFFHDDEYFQRTSR